ncbi:Copper amine oxidase N-terminal domain-containing protein [Paenibacillus sp. UNCCL117]|uniref:copper amine oxidase N-terminal domain-containing protein n=1 Tax=unclassified Paenibacillus TaxID=185978 RepID=UPI0008824E56|nr:MULTISPECIES: copper amine oxidase N-terminal domain-containing protein [unclassified Paenibacillus]SDE03398.1 Copper amine oxidase N-terminal domain-containing protein [Paenibacillus sp. cl123]SFW57404.1 Copper amine oxidase N-terminal domain-containing protein [Paenibacillus sp. UNCCL117]
MKKRSWNFKAGLMASALALGLAGCAPVGTVDVNKAISNTYSVKSAQGTSNLTLELVQTPSASLTSEQKRILDLFKNVKIDITDSKQESLTKASIKGTLSYGSSKIPFHFTMTDMDYTIDIEGAKKPIVIRNSAAFSSQAEGITLTAELQKQLQELTLKAVDSMPKLVGFFTNNFPNPKKISAEEASITVNGESLQTQKLSLEIKGGEVIGLVKGFLQNVLKDEEGLKEFIAVIYDLYMPIVKESMKAAAADEAGSMQMEQVAPFLENKTLAVEFIFTFLKSTLEKAVAEFDQTVDNLPGSEGGSLKEVLNDNQSLKMDLYLDKDHFTRKSEMEMNLAVPAWAEQGIEAVKITSTSEVWDINKPVTIDKVDVSGGVTDLVSDSGRMTASKFVSLLEPQSDLYKLLKNDLKITKKQISMQVPAPGDDSLSFLPQPYNEQGTVMVPVRFVTEQLDAEIEWDAAAKQVKITDPLTGSVAVLTIDSKEATVNGKAFALEQPAVLVEGSTYVPVRFVAESMSAKVGWTQETQTVEITRD